MYYTVKEHFSWQTTHCDEWSDLRKFNAMVNTSESYPPDIAATPNMPLAHGPIIQPTLVRSLLRLSQLKAEQPYTPGQIDCATCNLDCWGSSCAWSQATSSMMDSSISMCGRAPSSSQGVMHIISATECMQVLYKTILPTQRSLKGTIPMQLSPQALSRRTPGGPDQWDKPGCAAYLEAQALLDKQP